MDRIRYPVIVRAVAGETDALNEVLQHYRGYIYFKIRMKVTDRNGVSYYWTDKDIYADIENLLILFSGDINVY